ncbi:response regulator transcription factor [Microseira wollei]|uniref:Two component transcriptional regulator n=1 Tax=Microseira wollei NIES-4236 TaxID=2530354 RepID=A0AAV3XPY9_9CYAN|nr:response regulator transcription factor [Microseira wollei]GET41697.1 two component transcriptional regulator [Microseira wollei NIES-4236]
MRILVVEDDVQIADMLTEALTNRQYTVDVAQDGEMAWNWIETLEYDLVLLDITLPKMNGLLFCQKLRERNFSIPVLMLTARDTIADKIIGLDAGADAYMVKPFDLEELMAQIRALLRRKGSTTRSKLSWGNLSLDPDTYEVTFEQRLLHLTPKEYALLELLVSNGRRVLSRPGIIERLWSMDESPTEEAVKTHIRTLRQKLRAAGAPDDFIETVHGLGYRMKQLG